MERIERPERETGRKSKGRIESRKEQMSRTEGVRNGGEDGGEGTRERRDERIGEQRT